jgi:hypothetical protein
VTVPQVQRPVPDAIHVLKPNRKESKKTLLSGDENLRAELKSRDFQQIPPSAVLRATSSSGSSYQLDDFTTSLSPTSPPIGLLTHSPGFTAPKDTEKVSMPIDHPLFLAGHCISSDRFFSALSLFSSLCYLTQRDTLCTYTQGALPFGRWLFPSLSPCIRPSLVEYTSSAHLHHFTIDRP